MTFTMLVMRFLTIIAAMLVEANPDSVFRTDVEKLVKAAGERERGKQ